MYTCGGFILIFGKSNRAAGLRPDRPPGELVVPGALPVQRFPCLVFRVYPGD